MLTIHQYRALLKVDKHQLDSALEMHSTYQDEIAEQLALAAHAAYGAKEALNACESRLFSDFKESSSKITDATANAEVRKNRERQVLWDAMHECKRVAAEWEGLLDAWKSRGYNIKTLADLYVAQYFAISSVGPAPTRDPFKPTEAELRHRLRDASATVSRRRSIGA